MKSQILKTPLPYLALIVAHLIWGGNFVIAKLALHEFPSSTLAFLRFFLASVLLIPFLFSFENKEFKINLKHFPKLVIAGVLMVSLNIAFFYQGLIKTSAIDASVLTMSIPIISVLGGWWFLKEKIYWINFFGILLGFIGTVAILGVPLFFTNGFSTDSFIGNMFIMVSNIFYVIGAILSKQLLKDYHPIILTFIFFLIGALSFLLPAYVDYLNNPNWIYNISILGLLGLLYITLLSSISAFFLLNFGMEKITTITANLFHYIEPPVAATLAVFLLSERISFSFIIGTCLVALGVYWGTLGKAEHHHFAHKHHRA